MKNKKRKKKKWTDQSKTLQCLFVLNFSLDRAVILLKYLLKHICFMSTQRMGSEGGVTILRKWLYEVFFSLLLHKQIAYKTNSCCFEANLSELNVLNHFCNPTVLYLASPAAFPPPLIPLAKLEAASAFTKVQLWFQLLFCKRKWMLRFFLCGMVVIKLWCSYLSFR